MPEKKFQNFSIQAKVNNEALAKENIIKTIKSYINHSVNYIKDEIKEKKFLGHIKGSFKTKRGQIRFNFASEEQGVEISKNLEKKGEITGNLKVVFIFYDKNITQTKETKLKEKLKEKLKKYFKTKN